jgi:hypothetical protein
MDLQSTISAAQIQTSQRNKGIDRAAGTDYPMLGGWFKQQYMGAHEAIQAINEARSLRVPDFNPDASTDAPAPVATAPTTASNTASEDAEAAAIAARILSYS